MVVLEGQEKDLLTLWRLFQIAGGLRSLRLLSLSHCVLGPDTADALSGLILNKSRSLKELNLRNNKLGQESVARLAASLKANKSLTLLDVTGNGARPATLRQIAKCCADNSKTALLHSHQESPDQLLPRIEHEEPTPSYESDTRVARAGKETGSPKRQSEQLLHRLKSDLSSSALKHNEAKRENLLLRRRISKLQTCSFKSSLLQDERRQLLKENIFLKQSLEEKYRELGETRMEAQQQKLQLHLYKRQQYQQQLHLEVLQRQINEGQIVKDKLLSDLQQRELQLQQTELLLQKERHDNVRAHTAAAHQHATAESTQQALQQELEQLQEQHQQVQQHLIRATERHSRQQDELLLKQKAMHSQLQQKQHQIAELCQMLQRETACRQQAENERDEERHAHTGKMAKADLRIKGLQEQLREEQETQELQQQQMLQQQQRIAKAEKASAAAQAELEEMRSNQKHLEEKAVAAELNWQREQDLSNSRQVVIQQLRQQLREKHQWALEEKRALHHEAASAAARAEKQQQQLLQKLQQQERQQQQQLLELKSAQCEAQQCHANLIAIEKAHSDLKEELKRTREQCAMAQDQAQQSTAELRRRHLQWQQERMDLWNYLQRGIDQLHDTMKAASPPGNRCKSDILENAPQLLAQTAASSSACPST
ncbi:hypothetical protein Esti_002343 [Eimeria stiedai]